MFFKSHVCWKLPNIFMNDYLNYFGRMVLLNSLKTKPLKILVRWLDLGKLKRLPPLLDLRGEAWYLIPLHSMQYLFRHWGACMWGSEFIHAAVHERIWFKNMMWKDLKGFPSPEGKLALIWMRLTKYELMEVNIYKLSFVFQDTDSPLILIPQLFWIGR